MSPKRQKIEQPEQYHRKKITIWLLMILLLLFSLVLALYAGRLFFLQIIDTDGNTDNAPAFPSGCITSTGSIYGVVVSLMAAYVWQS